MVTKVLDTAIGSLRISELKRGSDDERAIGARLVRVTQGLAHELIPKMAVASSLTMRLGDGIEIRVTPDGTIIGHEWHDVPVGEVLEALREAVATHAAGLGQTAKMRRVAHCLGILVRAAQLQPIERLEDIELIAATICGE
jgi:hypothetical protein